MKKSLLAAAIIASTMSASLFAMDNSEVTITAELEKLASVHFESESKAFATSGATTEDMILEVGMHVGVRGLEETNNPYEITFGEAFGNGSAQPGEFVLYTDDGKQVPMELKYIADATEHDVVRDEKVAGQFTTDFNIAPDSAGLDYTKNSLKFIVKNQLNYDAGDYRTQIRATVAAI